MRTLKSRTALFLAIFLVFWAGCAEASDKKSKGSALSLECESFKDPHDKAACYGGQSKEAKANAEKARREATASEPESMRKARKEIEKRERRIEKARKEAYHAMNRAEVTDCPNGSVWVNPDAAQNVSGYTHTKLTVVNRSPVYVYIRQVSGSIKGVVVRGLCPGGSLSLFQGFNHDGNNTVQYMALGSGSLGMGGTSTSPQLTMSLCNYATCNEFATNWEIRLQ